MQPVMAAILITAVVVIPELALATRASAKTNLASFPPPVYDVRSFGAAGDGSGDDTLAIQRTADAIAAAGGGTVFLPAGTYRVSYIRPRANVRLAGQGRQLTRIVGNGANYSTIQFMNNADNGSITDMSVEGPANRSNNNFNNLYVIRADNSRNISVSNVDVSGGSMSGIFLRAIDGGNLNNISVTNIRSPSPGIGGVGVWLFFGTSNVIASDITIDGVDGHGFLIDAGTIDGLGGRQLYNNTLTRIAVSNFGQGYGANGIGFHGGEGTVADTLTVENGGTLTAVGISLKNDNTDIVAIKNSLNNVSIRNIPYQGLDLSSARSNTISNVSLRNVGTVGGYAVVFQASSPTTRAPVADNQIEDLTIVQDPGTRSASAVLFDQSRVACVRNHIGGVRLSTPPASPAAWQGGAPASGPDANDVLLAP